MMLYSFQRWLRRVPALQFLTLYALDGLAQLTPLRRWTPGGKTRVLVLRLDAIGDFVLWQDAMGALSAVFPPEQYELTLLGNAAWASLAGELLPFDLALFLERRRFLEDLRYRRELLAWVRAKGFAVVVNTVFSREPLLDDAIVRACGARVRIGSTGDEANAAPRRKRLADRAYTRLLPASAAPLMELERNAEFMRALGADEFQAGVPTLRVNASAPGEQPRKSFFVLFPGASWAGKQWPAGDFVRLAERLHARTGWTGLVCGSEDDSDFAAQIVEQAGVPLEDWTGQTSLPELAALIESAALLVGNDTSAVHIAAAVSTPSVCLLGGGDFGRFLPYRFVRETGGVPPIPVVFPMPCFGCRWRCIYRPPGLPVLDALPCVAQISVEAAWQAVCEILDKV